jgi:protein-L-isoaspartate(D-aspartate) O-methyltransferase
MNFEQARINMIEQQIRTWEVLDPAVLSCIGRVPREDFVPQRYRALAFCDTSIPLDHGQVMMAPKLEARMLQALAVRPGERCLEIGTGSGYVTALLAQLGAEVYSIDLYDDFIDAASTRLGKFGFDEAHLAVADGVAGYPPRTPYDAIAVTGSVAAVPEAFKTQLAPGGRLFVIVGASPVMEALLITRAGDHAWSTDSLFETELPPLIGLEPRPRFEF